jgi:hypothetical protein
MSDLDNDRLVWVSPDLLADDATPFEDLADQLLLSGRSSFYRAVLAVASVNPGNVSGGEPAAALHEIEAVRAACDVLERDLLRKLRWPDGKRGKSRHLTEVARLLDSPTLMTKQAVWARWKRLTARGRNPTHW